MLGNHTKTQKCIELLTVGIMTIWLLFTSAMGKMEVAHVDRSSFLPPLIFGIVLYGILSFFTIVPEATNIVTFKKYRGKCKSEVTKISRDFLCSVKLIIVLQLFVGVLLLIVNESLKAISNNIFTALLVVACGLYWLAYKRIN